MFVLSERTCNGSLGSVINVIFENSGAGQIGGGYKVIPKFHSHEVLLGVVVVIAILSAVHRFILLAVRVFYGKRP